jgi:hypothetical protein
MTTKTERLGRNDPCWCGSGEKYKKCHLHREQEKPLPAEALSAESGRFFRTKKCLHPLASSESCGKIIEAHTIQRGGALAGIVDKSGHVLSFYPLRPTKPDKPRKVGWRDASTFSGFCQRHDGETFRPLEQKVFVGSDEQCFLLAYRAQCHELYQKQASDRSHEPLSRLIDRGKSPEEQRVIQRIHGAFAAGVHRGSEDARTHKERMDTELLQGQYSDWRRLFISFEGQMCVVSTGVPTPNHNFAGDELQTLHDLSSRLQSLYFGPVKSQQGGVWVFLWRPEDDAPRRFLEDIQKVPREFLPNMLVQFMFAYVENTFFSIEWWESLSSQAQEHLIRLARMGNPYYNNWKYMPGAFVPWRITSIASTYAAV